MTVDEVIAGNVRRIREDQGLSVSELASRMRVGRHLVYDFERPRPGAAQRQFLWSDLVALCHALDTTLFDLVLPDDGEDVELPTGSMQARAALDRMVGLQGAAEISWRGWLSQTMFAIAAKDLTAALIERLASWRREEETRRAEVRLDILKEIKEKKT